MNTTSKIDRNKTVTIVTIVMPRNVIPVYRDDLFKKLLIFKDNFHLKITNVYK